MMSSASDNTFPDFGIPRSEIMQLINNRYHHSSLPANSSRLGPSEADLTARIQELNEMRQRATQMENTMRWWAKCTVMWRDKWRAVRNERNQARADETSLKKALYAAREELQTACKARDDAQAKVKDLECRLHELHKGEHKGDEQHPSKSIPLSTVDKEMQTDGEVEEE